MSFKKQTLTFLPGWSFSETLWKPIESLILQVDHPEKSTLIGWSFGGLKAIELCLLEPHRYDELILINSAPYFSQFSAHYWEMANHDLPAFQKQFLRWVFYPQHQRKIENWQEHFILATDDTRELLLTQLEVLFTTNLCEAYQTLTLPILRIQGSEDAIVSPWSSTTPMPNETVKIISGSHTLPFTHTSLLAQIISDFLCNQ